MTPPPTASTTPANSHPRTVAFGLRSPLKSRTIHGLPDRNPQSVRFTVAARTLTSTSSSPAAGLSTSAIRITSGGPYRAWMAALIANHDRRRSARLHLRDPRFETVEDDQDALAFEEIERGTEMRQSFLLRTLRQQDLG